MFSSNKNISMLKSCGNYPQKSKEEEFFASNSSITTEKKTLGRKDMCDTFEIEKKLKPYNFTKSIDVEEWKHEMRELKSSCSQTILHIQNHNENEDSNVSESERNQNSAKCKNNDGKKAKYQTVNSKQEEGIYCLKCSIKLLQRGIQIIEMPETQQKKKVENIKPLLDELNKSYGVLQNNCKALQNNYFFIQIDEQKQKIVSIYDSILKFIQKLRDNDVQKLSFVKAKTIKQSKQQMFLLKNIQKKMKPLIKDLSHFNDLDESIRKLTKQSSEKLIHYTSQYQPLEFTMKRQDSQTIKQKIFDHISREFNQQEYPIHFSFNDKSQFLDTSQSNHQTSLLQIKEANPRSSENLKIIHEKHSCKAS